MSIWIREAEVALEGGKKKKSPSSITISKQLLGMKGREREEMHFSSTGVQPTQDKVNIISLITFSIRCNPHNRELMEHEAQN